MAEKTIQNLRNRATQVRDETLPEANTALRVGGFLLDFLETYEAESNRHNWRFLFHAKTHAELITAANANQRKPGAPGRVFDDPNTDLNGNYTVVLNEAGELVWKKDLDIIQGLTNSAITTAIQQALSTFNGLPRFDETGETSYKPDRSVLWRDPVDSKLKLYTRTAVTDGYTAATKPDNSTYWELVAGGVSETAPPPATDGSVPTIGKIATFTDFTGATGPDGEGFYTKTFSIPAEMPAPQNLTPYIIVADYKNGALLKYGVSDGTRGFTVKYDPIATYIDIMYLASADIGVETAGATTLFQRLYGTDDGLNALTPFAQFSTLDVYLNAASAPEYTGIGATGPVVAIKPETYTELVPGMRAWVRVYRETNTPAAAVGIYDKAGVETALLPLSAYEGSPTTDYYELECYIAGRWEYRQAGASELNVEALNAVPATHARALELRNLGQLLPGVTYKITDYRTRVQTPNSPLVNEGPILPIYVTAVAANSFGVIAAQEGSKHELEFNIDATICEDGSARPGLIIRRTDKIKGLSAPWDWEVLTWRRYWGKLFHHAVTKTTASDFSIAATYANKAVPGAGALRYWEVFASFQDRTNAAGAILTVTKDAVSLSRTMVTPAGVPLALDQLGTLLTDDRAWVYYSPRFDAFVISPNTTDADAFAGYVSTGTGNFSSGYDTYIQVDGNTFLDYYTFGNLPDGGQLRNITIEGSNNLGNIVFTQDNASVHTVKFGPTSKNATINTWQFHEVIVTNFNNVIIQGRFYACHTPEFLNIIYAMAGNNRIGGFQISQYCYNVTILGQGSVFETNGQNLNYAILRWRGAGGANVRSFMFDFVADCHLYAESGTTPKGVYTAWRWIRSVGVFINKSCEIGTCFHNITFIGTSLDYETFFGMREDEVIGIEQGAATVDLAGYNESELYPNDRTEYDGLVLLLSKIGTVLRRNDAILSADVPNGSMLVRTPNNGVRWVNPMKDVFTGWGGWINETGHYAASGTGAIVQAADVPDAVPGFIELNTGTTTTGAAASFIKADKDIASARGGIRASLFSSMVIEQLVSIPVLSGTTEDYHALISISAPTPVGSVPANAVMVSIRGSYMYLVGMASGVETIDTAQFGLYSAPRPAKIRLEWEPNNAVARLFVDGVLRSTLSTGFPATSLKYAFDIRIIKKAGTSNRILRFGTGYALALGI